MVPNTGDSSASTNGAHSDPSQSLSATDGTGQALENGSLSQRQLEHLPPMIDDFDGIINGEVKTFVNMSEEIGGLVAEQVIYSTNWKSKIFKSVRPDDIVSVRCCTTGFRCSTQVPYSYHQSQETRYPVACLHGNLERAAINDGLGQ